MTRLVSPVVLTMGMMLAMCAWGISLLVFSQHQQSTGSFGSGWSPTLIATVANLIGLPATILTNEMARVYHRHLVIITVMVLSAMTGLFLGWSLTGLF